MLQTGKGRVRCRSIVAADLDKVADLLSHGFNQRSKAFWMNALQRLSSHPTPEGFEKYGYILEAADAPVGALLVISSVSSEQPAVVRCNVSSWYVLPEFRSYGPLLSSRAARRDAAVYLNVDPARPTWPIIEAQGFRRFSEGVFASVPCLSVRSQPATVSRFDKANMTSSLSQQERTLLSDHDTYGCIGLCVSADGHDYPFVFRKRRFRFPVPCAELIYCRRREDVVRFARPLGNFLMKRGMPWLLLSASASIKHLPGVYFKDKLPLYSRGAVVPRLGDLTYTEVAMFGL